MISTHSTILLKNIVLVDQHSDAHNQETDILIKDGIISAIGADIAPEDAYVVDGKGFFAGGGWCDVGSHCGEPGDEVHETLQTLQAAGQAGGYTRLALFSNAVRPFDDRHIVRDIQSRLAGSPSIMPLGAVTKHLAGDELCELLDIAEIAPPLFTDGFSQRAENAMMYKALEYAKQCNGRIACIPGALPTIKPGHVNESKVSAQMGLPGLPGFEEVAKLSGLLSIVSYADARFLAHLISHAEAVDQIKFRKEQGLDVLASVSAMHLLHTEEDVASFDENFKILPPLRADADRAALIKGLKDGTIDFVSSNHRPIAIEQKAREFGESPFGAIGLETTFYSLVTAIEDISATDICQWLSIGPRQALNLPAIRIAVGQPAELTLFSLSGESTFVSKNSASLSRNTPYSEQSFSGRIGGSIHGTSLHLSPSF